METITIRIKGDALLMHNVRNPMDEIAKRMKALTSVRKKTDENYAEIADIEFEGGIYHDPDLGPYLPGIWLDACVIEGGKLQKNGTRIRHEALTEDQRRENADALVKLSSIQHLSSPKKWLSDK
jgi:hypothetical protein